MSSKRARRHRTLPTAVWGDETRLRQVLLNLISNAVKFTPEETVRVKVDCSRDNGVVELRVGLETECAENGEIALKALRTDLKSRAG